MGDVTAAYFAIAATAFGLCLLFGWPEKTEGRVVTGDTNILAAMFFSLLWPGLVLVLAVRLFIDGGRRSRSRDDWRRACNRYDISGDVGIARNGWENVMSEFCHICGTEMSACDEGCMYGHDRLDTDTLDALELNLETLRQCGFAPGSYIRFCSECGKVHTAAKCAWRCLECAERRADIPPSPAQIAADERVMGLVLEIERYMPVLSEAIDAHGIGGKHGIATCNALRAALAQIGVKP